MAEGGQEVEACFVQGAEFGGVVHAAAGWGEVGAFEVDAQDAWNAGFDSLFDGAHGAVHDVQAVADEGGEEACCAIGAVRAADGGDAFGGGVVVEEDSAAAVHLDVDEAWGEEVSA